MGANEKAAATYHPDHDTKVDALEGLDFEPTVPCSSKTCEQKAEWALTILCPSRHGSLMCTAHHDRWVADALTKTYLFGARCSDCGPKTVLTVPPYWDWRRLA